MGSVFNLKSADITASGNTYQHCYFAKTGVWTLDGGSLEEISPIYTKLAAYFGSCVYCQECDLTIHSGSFTNLIAREGGAFYLTQGANLVIDTTPITFTNITALRDGGVL